MEQSDHSASQQILTLAAEIAEATDREVPHLLLEVRDVIKKAAPGSKQLKQCKQDIWSYELIQVLVLVLKQNFDVVRGQWSTAAELATFTSNVFIGFEPPDTHQYFGICLPDASENLLMLARKLQIHYIEQSDETQKKEMLDHFRTTLEAVNTLFSGHVFLTNHVLRSLWLLQMLITDDPDTSHSALNVIQYAIRVNHAVISELGENVLHSLLDEMVFKITSGVDKYVASSAISTLILICKVKPYFIEIICQRYRGLRPLMSRWSGQGLGRELKEIVGLLDAGNAKRAETEKFHRAATLIQCVYRSYKTRKSIQKANTALSKFQKSFRHKKKLKQRDDDERRMQAELQHQLLVSRKRAMRSAREKHIQILGMLPPSAIQKYLEETRHQSALRIQSYWRGYRTRRVLAERREAVIKSRAATTIQRAVRKLLKRQELTKKEPAAWSKPSGLTDERRVYLQKVILSQREANPAKARTREEQVALHDRCQELLKRHVFVNRINMRKQIHREALLAELQTDSDLILNAPKLQALGSNTDNKQQPFLSHSVPISTKARENHNNEMRLLNQPWWRKLGDEFQDSHYEEDFIL